MAAQAFCEGLQVGLCGEGKEFQQIREATVDGTDMKAFRVVEQFCHGNVGMAHPETFSDIGYAPAVGVSQSVDNSPFQVTDFDRFLFGDPVYGVPEKILVLQKKKMELGAM